jgi:NADP-dependent 3-hydroxy acid dehydrogenase YdfG
MTGALSGRVALVTGASSGIGEAVALALAAAGAAVAVTARRADRLQQLVQRIESGGGRAVALPANVAEERAAKGVVADTVERLGRLDVLVNSAGVIQAGGVEHADLDEWRRVIEINLLAALYTSHAAIPHMKSQGGGDIVNISSTAGRRASADFLPYSVSKFGLTALNDGMRQELGQQGIRVCIIEPGATTTEVAEGITDAASRDRIRKHVSKDGAMKPEDVAAAIMLAVCLPRRANVVQLQIRPTIDVTPA